MQEKPPAPSPVAKPSEPRLQLRMSGPRRYDRLIARLTDAERGRTSLYLMLVWGRADPLQQYGVERRRVNSLSKQTHRAIRMPVNHST
ncbi:hypothetical protein P3T23_009046 [Paraburkholderia sp. GAS448]